VAFPFSRYSRSHLGSRPSRRSEAEASSEEFPSTAIGPDPIDFNRHEIFREQFPQNFAFGIQTRSMPPRGRALPKSEAKSKGRGRGRGSTATERRRLNAVDVLTDYSTSAEAIRMARLLLPEGPVFASAAPPPSAEQVGLSDADANAPGLNEQAWVDAAHAAETRRRALSAWQWPPGSVPPANHRARSRTPPSPISDHLRHHHRRRTPSPPLSDHTSGLSDDDSTLSLPQTLPAGQDRVEEPPVEEEEEGPYRMEDFIVLETRREQEDRRIRSLQARVHRLDAEVRRAIRVHAEVRRAIRARAALLRAVAQLQLLRSGVEPPAP
jgi:hypothetical protein